MRVTRGAYRDSRMLTNRRCASEIHYINGVKEKKSYQR